MTVYLANYPVLSNGTAYAEQSDKIIDAIQTYGYTHVGGVTVGNEVVLEYDHLYLRYPSPAE